MIGSTSKEDVLGPVVEKLVTSFNLTRVLFFFFSSEQIPSNHLKATEVKM